VHEAENGMHRRFGKWESCGLNAAAITTFGSNDNASAILYAASKASAECEFSAAVPAR